jgi:hypothetical protein
MAKGAESRKEISKSKLDIDAESCTPVRIGWGVDKVQGTLKDWLT